MINNLQFFVGLMFVLSSARRGMSYPVQLIFYLLLLHAKYASAFNKKILKNVLTHFEDNIADVAWQINESGFVRARLPIDILDRKDPIFSNYNVSKLSLRCNFWYGEIFQSVSTLKDAAAHDHPNPFVSYIVANGYTHAIYEFLFYDSLKNICSEEDMADNRAVKCANFDVFDKVKGKKNVIGAAYLRLVDVMQSEPGDVVLFDDKAIHRILTYMPNTLSLNVVNHIGKKTTNLFHFPELGGQSKLKRKTIEGKDALPITLSAIKLFQLAIDGISEENKNKGKLLEYTNAKYRGFFNNNTVISAIPNEPILPNLNL